MKYELYIDVFFLVNFMMDHILLLITRRILRCRAGFLRISLGAALGALLTCVVVIMPIPYAFVKFMLFHGFVNVVMIKTGLGIKWDRTFVKAFAVLYISGFLVGGVFDYLHQYVRTGSLFFALAVASYYIVLGTWNLISHLARRRDTRCETVLYRGDKSCRAEALIDTGNCLRDSVTGSPVSIVDPELVKELCGSTVPEGLRYIPYHTVGRKQAVMPMITLDKMCVFHDGEKWIEKPAVGICEGNVSADGTYRMILNPDIL